MKKYKLIIIKDHILILLDDEGDTRSDHRKKKNKSKIISTRLNRDKLDISLFLAEILRQHLFSTWIFCYISNILNMAVDFLNTIKSMRFA